MPQLVQHAPSPNREPASEAVLPPAVEKESCANNTDNSPGRSTELVQVVRLQQLHFVPGMKEAVPSLYRQVAESQFKIATYLVSHPGSVVINENQFYDLTPQIYQEQNSAAPPTMIDAARIIFPFGLPATYEQLNDVQRDFLAEEGGARTLFYLGKQSHVMAEAAKNDAVKNAIALKPYFEKFGTGREFFEAMDKNPELQELFGAARERATTQRVQAFAMDKSFVGRQIIVVYGGTHDFVDDFLPLKNFALETVDLRGQTKTPEQGAVLRLPPADTMSADFDDLEFPETDRLTEDPDLVGSLKKWADFKGDHVDALRYYSNRSYGSNANKEMATLIEEQQSVVQTLIQSNTVIPASSWHNLLSPTLQIQMMPLLDPLSLNGLPYNIQDLRERAAGHPELQQFVEDWIAKNRAKVPARGRN